jgi:threonine dehydrogenase-like Zn-dependent dehydrogenase
MLGDPVLMGGFNRIYDSVGNSSTLNLGMRILAAFGTLSVVVIGKEVKLDLTPLWLKLQTLKGVYGHGMVTHTFRLEDYLEMIDVNMNKGKHNAIKTLVSFS